MRNYFIHQWRGTRSYNWDCVIGGIDRDHCLVDLEIEAPEPDVGVPGGVNILAIWFEDEGDILEHASDAELRKLTEEIEEYMRDLAEGEP